ncbi:peptidylprolyl isomerase [Pseudoruegeria sp. HB172150]|uniref:peptidylprolyl isomerase n=1 Tax=Pseudoruegeria sp. HB172150 TaxID=2721164 RepID=UPI0015548A63|nr:peptidylprolyl isomerase [Pseudoruegeria sp. HB172150]
MACKNTLFGAAALCLSLSLPALAQDTTEAPADVTRDTVVATVNGFDITVGHMIAMRLSLSEQNQQLPDDVIFEGLLERLIQQRAVSASVDEVDEGTKLAIENEESALIASKKVTDLAEAIVVSEDELQAAYDAEYADYTPIKEFNASHILVATEEEAQALAEELEGGADFAELAKEKSTGPSGPNGGELGWFSPGMMVKPFEDAVMAMETGAISEPVQTQFGWHVIKLNETRLPEAPALEEVKDELEAKLWDEKLRAEVAALVDGAEIERPDVSGIDPAILKDTSLIGY